MGRVGRGPGGSSALPGACLDRGEYGDKAGTALLRWLARVSGWCGDKAGTALLRWGVLGEVSGGMRLLQSGAGCGFDLWEGGAAEFDAFFDIGADGVLDVFGGDAEGVFHGEWA